MIEIPDVPEMPHPHRERGRNQLQSTDDNSDHTPLIIYEADGFRTIHGLGASGVTLPAAEVVALCEQILGRAG